MTDMPREIVKATKKTGDRWEVWLDPRVVPNLKGTRAKRRTVHAESEGEAKEEGYRIFAPFYPVMLLTGKYNAIEVAVSCIDAMEAEGKWARPKTASEYRSLIKNHCGELPAKPLNEISQRELRQMCARLQQSGLSSKTIGKLKTALSNVFEYLIEDGLMASNPTRGMRLPAQAETNKRTFTEAEFAAFMNALSDEFSKDHMTDSDITKRNALFGALVALYTGMRAGEVCALVRGDVRFADETIRVEKSLTEEGGLHPKPPKTKSSARAIAIDDALMRAVEDHYRWQAGYMTDDQRRDDSTPLCCKANGQPFPPKTMSSLFKAFCIDQAKIDLKKGESFHILRHTHASLLLAGKVDVKSVSARLGHSSPSVTLDNYAHLMAGADDQAAADFSAIAERTRKAGGYR